MELKSDRSCQHPGRKTKHLSTTTLLYGNSPLVSHIRTRRVSLRMQKEMADPVAHPNPYPHQGLAKLDPPLFDYQVRWRYELVRMLVDRGLQFDETEKDLP